MESQWKDKSNDIKKLKNWTSVARKIAAKMKISVWECVGSTPPACSPPPLPRKVAQMVQYIADMLKKLLSLKLAHRLCIVPLGTSCNKISCNKILFHKSSILAVKMTIYWISYEVQKESQANLWPIANYFNFLFV